MAACGGTDLPATIGEARGFAHIYQQAGHQLRSGWEDADVWGSDFREAGGGDVEPQGGSDLVELYLFAGHGICQASPTATDPDFISVCSPNGQPNDVTIGTEVRWGNHSSSSIQYAVIDASCPMDLISIANSWFPVFRGMHIAMGHSGNASADTLDSPHRGWQFGAYSTGSLFYPHYSVGEAWLSAGTVDIQDGCCAVALAAGVSRDDALWRRDHETIGVHSTFNFTPAWFAWKWRCA
jgi:hypothetical protein